MLLDNPIADAQAQTRTLSDRLGGEEWVKNLIQILWAMPEPLSVTEIVTGVVGGTSGNGQDATVDHGRRSIQEQIEEHLLQLIGVAQNIGQVLAKILFDVDQPHFFLVFHQADDSTDDGVDIQRYFCRWSLPCEVQQSLHNFGRSLGLVDDQVQVFPVLVSVGMTVGNR